MKKRYRQILASILASALMTGCGSTGDASSAVSATENKASSATVTVSDNNAMSVSESAETLGGSTFSTVTGESFADELSIASRRGGDLVEIPAENQLEEADEETAAEMDRAIRAYTPSGTTLLENNAEEFYYYEHLDDRSQMIYDVMLQIASDPRVDEGQLISSFTSDADPMGDEYQESYWAAFWGLVLDHPELFWLYNYLETTFAETWFKSGNKWTVYMYLKSPFSDYKTMMNTFNDAAEDFLADIDTDQTEWEIARDVHDKLIELVTYDYPVCESGEYANLAHTAYGCLVGDSDGNENYAVCDGYSLAYEYLLQQLGITAVVVLGMGGTTAGEAGGHAWNLANLDGKWYEIDSTWDDDNGSYAAWAADSRTPSNFREALNDNSFMDKMRHTFYGLTTSRIRNFTPNEDEYYTASDGSRVTFIGKSFHIRMSDVTASSPTGKYQGELMKYAPIAK